MDYFIDFEDGRIPTHKCINSIHRAPVDPVLSVESQKTTSS